MIDPEDHLKGVENPAIANALRTVLVKHADLEQKFLSAFPGGDYQGHARYHDEVILMMQDRRKTRQAVVEQVVKGSVWALLLSVGAACWQYFKDHARLP